MLTVLACIAFAHNPWLVLLAVGVCIAGCTMGLRIYARALHAQGTQRLGWLFLAAAGAGFSIWCTHFVAMLAFEAPTIVSFEPGLTALSLIVAVLGSVIGVVVSAGPALASGPSGLSNSSDPSGSSNSSGSSDPSGRGLPGRAALGGALLGLAVAAMHYLGMLAYRVTGMIHWDQVYIVASIVLAVVPSAAALQLLARGRGRHRLAQAVALLVTAIIGLHFTAMTAVQITPLVENSELNQGEAFLAMALAVAAVGLTILAVGFVSFLVEGQTRRDARERLRYLSAHDGMTGLPNRVSLNLHLEASVESARRDGGRFAAIAIDLYRFKEINDNHGHATGDEILRALGRRLAEAGLPGVFFARIGGDEFAAIARLPDGGTLEDAILPLKAPFGEPVCVGALEVQVDASFGVAVFPRDGGNGETVLRNAESAMVRAKSAGAQHVCFYDSGIDEEQRQRRALAADLRHAIARHEFALHYQVQASVDTGRIRGFEALLRWCHPVRGMIPPATFIPLAEEEGMIGEIGRWVLREACREACKWPDDQTVAVNLSPIEIVSPDLPGVVAAILAETGLPARRLEVELTESAIIRDTRRCLEVIEALKALGVGVALDDFGTGYSSLSLLRTFPFDRIKLDRSFVYEVETSREALGIVKAVLALGDVLGASVLAEGIETESQLTALGQAGIREAQGYLLGRPVPAEKRPEGEGLQIVVEIQRRGQPAMRIDRETALLSD